MDITVFQAAAAMNASSRWQEVIADNLSASQIPGFKKQDMTFSAVQAGYMGRRMGESQAANQRFVMPLAGSVVNFAPGELRPTGIPTDLAIEGPGFFSVQSSDGRISYTRDGEFRIDPKGALLTKRGLSVMGENGPIQVDPNGIAVTINAAGEVYQGGITKGKLNVVEFGNPTALIQNGNGTFSATTAAGPRGNTESSVRQGFVENANTSTMVEMGNLITAMRFYEANQRVVQTEDERVSRLISEVANPV